MLHLVTNMEENTFLNADNIYEEVEGESGVALTLEEDQQRNLIGIIQGRFAQAEDSRLFRFSKLNTFRV